MVECNLQEGLPEYLPLWWDFCYRGRFQEMFLFLSVTLTSSFVGGCQHAIFPTTCNLPYLQAFLFFADLTLLFLPFFFSLFPMYMIEWHHSSFKEKWCGWASLEDDFLDLLTWWELLFPLLWLSWWNSCLFRPCSTFLNILLSKFTGS